MEREPDAIGAANFNIALLKTVVDEIKAPIACKIEYHVMLDQTRLRRFLTAKSIPLLACCPVGATACGHQSGARENRPQAQCERRAGSTEMADRSGRRLGYPQGVARGKPAGNLDALRLK
jgi:2,5-diketo-D-gluconate reductase B